MKGFLSFYSFAFGSKGRRYYESCLLIIGYTLFSALLPARAQDCRVTTFTDPPRQELDCADGLSIVAERATEYRLLDRNRDGRPEAVEVRSRALMVDYPRRRGGFQILTPHAMAAVRGTIWVVDVSAARTSVFVRVGAVSVRRPGTPQTVTLGPGEGVDVDSGPTPLQVRRWPAERAANLLARLGR